MHRAAQGKDKGKDKGVLLPNHHFSSAALLLRKHHEDMPALCKTDLRFVDAGETRWFPFGQPPTRAPFISPPRRARGAASLPSVHLLATRAAPSAPMWVVEARQRASPDQAERAELAGEPSSATPT